jgi:transposase
MPISALGAVVRIPTIEEEDLRRSHRERGRLISERTAHINRIRGLLFAQGIRIGNSIPKTLALEKLVTGDARPLPWRLAAEITRQMKRLAVVREVG